MVGKTAIATFLTSDPIAPSALSWTTIKSDVSNDASQGYTWTQGSVTIDIGGGPLTLPGMALIYWKREGAGDWQVAAINISSGGPQTLPIPDGFDTPDTKHRRNFPNTDAAAQAEQLLAVDGAFSDASLERTLGRRLRGVRRARWHRGGRRPVRLRPGRDRGSVRRHP